jgi:hypothetical protein
MALKPLPIGIQDFKSLRTDDYLYIDKTEAYFQNFEHGKYFFLSRPRRFGKSILLSTLKYLYKGEKDLFNGLWIEDKWDWEKEHPVIHVDLSQIDTRNSSLQIGLMMQMQRHAQTYDITLRGNSATDCFQELIYELGKSNEKCVVLIDEYDKPITDYITDAQTSIQHIKELKSFYGVLKGADQYLHKVVITGVSKYGKVSVFSDLNNLAEISMKPEAALVCGYTQQELEHYFDEYIDEACTQFEVDRTALLAQIRYWYNGFTFDTKMSEKLYNPFSILNFFSQYDFRNFWYATGTPTFLAEMIAEEEFRPENLEYFKATDLLFQSADIDNIDALSLLYQTGYLTIKNIQKSGMTRIYTLGYPNYEVRESFVVYLMAIYMQETPSQISQGLIVELKLALMDRDWQRIINVLNHVFATVPYQIFGTNEAYYHSLVHVTLTLSGFLVLSELLTNKGRIDTVLETDDLVVIFEFKMNSTAEIALAQIKEKKYAERYAKSDKDLFLIGVNFDSEERKITSWVVE